MDCLNPGHRWLYRPLTGEAVWTAFPCGHCVNCLHKLQDSWSIRINESIKASCNHEFIYDTLTFAPANMPFKVLDSVDLNKISSESRSLLSRYSQEYARVTGGDFQPFVVPNFERSIIRDWIRRGRELFVFDHGYRPKWKYFVVSEYGPKTSRPHAHLVMMNISLGDYVRYFAKPWRRDYGFTKTKLVSNDTKKGRQCISRYVSKYVSKGVFESPLVKDGLAVKPFRSISHGIGEEYLSHPRFNVFRTPLAEALKKYTAVPFVVGEHSGGVDYSGIQALEKSFITPVVSLSDDMADSLTRYVDESSFVHSSPRYFKSKLLNSFKPNYYAVKIQDLLLSRYSDYYSKCLFKFALQMGYSQRVRETSDLGLSPLEYDALSRQFVSSERIEAQIKARRRYVKLKNHYFRPLRDKAFAIVS